MRRADEIAAIERHVATKGVTKPKEATIEPVPDGWVEAWTDGACLGNPGRGGWGVVLIFRGRRRELYGGEPETTNNRMELTAAIQALEALKRPCRLRLYSDSRYVVHGAAAWIKGWKRKNWRTRQGTAVANVDLWMRLDLAAHPHKVQWRWVKGHAGTEHNERADTLANIGACEAAKRPNIR